MTTGCGGQELGHDYTFLLEQVFISESLAMPREEDFVTRAKAQCLKAVRRERRDATPPLQKLNKIFNFQDLGPEEDLLPAKKRSNTELMESGSILSALPAAVFLGFLGRSGCRLSC